MSAHRWIALGAIALVTAGCMVLIGESFDGYGPRTDAGDAMTMMDSGVFGSFPHPIEGCTPMFTVANGIGYPDHAPPAFDVDASFAGGIITDNNPSCYQPPNQPKLPYCLVLASSFHIEQNATLGVFGSRPLAIVAVHDVNIEGLLDVAGTDAYGQGGPGMHVGSAVGFGGGGAGVAEPGASACGAAGGVPGEAGLVGGGNGGGGSDSNPNCHAGGFGGGAVELVSLCGSIRVSGTINASGGGGQSVDDPSCAVGFGGGGGGLVWIQADSFTLDTLNGASINVAGGGGGGGTCRDSGAVGWATGQPANREVPGVGAQCGTSAGADGGFGGFRAASPVPGAPGTEIAPGQAGCSGGGGGRGLVVLQTSSNTCLQIAGWQSGICSELKLQ